MGLDVRHQDDCGLTWAAPTDSSLLSVVSTDIGNGRFDFEAIFQYLPRTGPPGSYCQMAELARCISSSLPIEV